MHNMHAIIVYYDNTFCRYMARYVAIKLLRVYRKGSRNTLLATKYKIFTTVLGGMKADMQPGNPDSANSHATLWEELIDRGGLYIITFKLIESLEMVVCRFLIVDHVVHGTDLYKTKPVMCW